MAKYTRPLLLSLAIATTTLAMLLTITVACSNRAATANVPGSANQFDSDTYLTLVSAKAVIDQTKTELAANAFEPKVAAVVKQAVNDAVSTYNVLDVTYQAYHNSALAGTATAEQQAAVQAASTNLKTTVSNITNSKGVLQ